MRIPQKRVHVFKMNDTLDAFRYIIYIYDDPISQKHIQNLIGNYRKKNVSQNVADNILKNVNCSSQFSNTHTHTHNLSI